MMPGYLLHMGATIICMHAGQAMPVSTNPRVKVSGQAIVTQSDTHSISGCALTGTQSPPCVTAQWISAATRVTAGSVPVLLQDSQSICAPSGAKLNVVMTQMRVRGT
jgi:hypothetical protein